MQLSQSANQSKTKWNAANYTQVKAYVDPEIAKAFKAACEASGVSMNRELTRFMASYCDIKTRAKPVKATDFISTNRKRRKKHDELISQLMLLRDAQEYANDNVPENLRNTENFANSEERVSKMDEAIEILDGIY